MRNQEFQITNSKNYQETLCTERCQFVLVKPSIPKLVIPEHFPQALLIDKCHSSTFNASRKLLPLFGKIPFESQKKLPELTMDEFNLSLRDERLVLGAPQNDHMEFNVKLAKNYKIF